MDLAEAGRMGRLWREGHGGGWDVRRQGGISEEGGRKDPMVQYKELEYLGTVF